MSKQLSFCVIFGFILSLFLPIFLSAGISLGTLVSTDKGMVPVECLSKGDLVQGFDLAYNTVCYASIQEIISHEQASLLCIKTSNSLFFVTEDQKFYDAVKHEFIEASQLSPVSKITTIDFFSCCTNITKCSDSAICYELVLDELHSFFITEDKVLVHNFSPCISLSTNAAQWFIGTIVGLLYVDRAPDIFRSVEDGIRRLSKQVDHFVQGYSRSQRRGLTQIFSREYITRKLVHPCIGGIRPDSDIYEDILRYPYMHGPMCLTALACNDGKIECSLHVLSFDHIEYLGKNKSKPIFKWKLFGKDVLPHTHPFVKNFVKQENEKSSKIVRELVGRIPFEYRTNFANFSIHAINKHLLFDPVCSFYGTQFAAHALYCIAQKHIPIISILHTMNFGRSKSVKNAACMIFWDRKEKIAVLVEKGSKRVLSVGRYPTDMALLDEKAPETDERTQIIENIVGEATPSKQKSKRGKRKKRKVKTTQYEKPEAQKGNELEDFKRISPDRVRRDGDKIIGDIPGQITVIARPKSREGRATLEIQYKETGNIDKIRYGKPK